MATGVVRLHSRGCPSKAGGRCRCKAGYEAWVYSQRDGKKIRKTFAREGEAKTWRTDAQRALNHGTLRAPTRRTLAEAAEAWLEGAETGQVRNRSGQPYKPSTVRGYRQALEEQVLPAIGAAKLSAVTTSDLQALVDRWQADGQAASTIRNAIKPLQAIYRRARSREGLPVNPTHDLEMPAPRPHEVEIVSPATAAQLLEALDSTDRAVWTTALYAGLRYGELRALRWGAVDTASGRIEVRESWDPREGSIEPKTRTSRRTVPMPGVLREALLTHRLQSGDVDERSLVFGAGADAPFHAVSLYRRADAAWAVDAARRARRNGLQDLEGRDLVAALFREGHSPRAIAVSLELEQKGVRAMLADEPRPARSAPLQRLRLHQARHTYASFMIAAGVNAKALAAFMGHSSIKVTFDLYGHLMPGTEDEAAAMLDAFVDAQVRDGAAAARAADDMHVGGGTGERTGERDAATA